MPVLEIGLTPKQAECDELLQRVENVFYGGAKGGGKSVGMRYIFLKAALATPNLEAVIFRKTYPELYGNHISKIHKEFPELKSFFNATHKEYNFPNGSKLMFRFNQYTRDLENHQGVEYHWLGIEEAGEWPEDWFWTLKGSNRSSNPKIKPRCLLTGNPGGVGHKWLKRLFIDRNFRSVEEPFKFGFIPAKVQDNPALMDADPEYVSRLKMNKNQMLVHAYLEGSWDLQAGQFFDMVSRETHVVEPFEIPDYWEWWSGYDHGYNHPAAFVLGTTDTDGNSYVVWEYAASRKRVEEVVFELMQNDLTNKVVSVPAGWDCWAKHGTGPSVEEKFIEASNGALVLEKANIDRVLGAQQLRDYLAVRETGPRLRWFSHCQMSFDGVCRMEHDPKRPEDVLKVDAVDGDPWTGDDLYDAIRHGLMSRPKIGIKPPDPKKKRYFEKEKIVTTWVTV